MVRANFENVFMSFNLDLRKPNLVLSYECTKHLLVGTKVLQDFGKCEVLGVDVKLYKERPTKRGFNVLRKI